MTDTSLHTMQRLAANTRVGYSFDQEFYTSDAVFKADMDQIISQKWILAGHISRPPTAATCSARWTSTGPTSS